MTNSRYRYISAGLHTLQDRERRLRQLERLLDQVSQRRRGLRQPIPQPPDPEIEPYLPSPEARP